MTPRHVYPFLRNKNFKFLLFIIYTLTHHSYTRMLNIKFYVKSLLFVKAIVAAEL